MDTTATISSLIALAASGLLAWRSYASSGSNRRTTFVHAAIWVIVIAVLALVLRAVDA